jgi:hypothetical protein
MAGAWARNGESVCQPEPKTIGVLVTAYLISGWTLT